MTSQTSLQALQDKYGPIDSIASLSLATDDLNDPALVGASMVFGKTEAESWKRDALDLLIRAGDPRRNENMTGISWEAFQEKAIHLNYAEDIILKELDDRKIKILVINQSAWNRKVIGFSGYLRLSKRLDNLPVWYMSESEAVRESLGQTVFDSLSAYTLKKALEAPLDHYRKCNKRRRLADYACRLLGEKQFIPWDGSTLFAAYTAKLMMDMCLHILDKDENSLLVGELHDNSGH